MIIEGGRQSYLAALALIHFNVMIFTRLLTTLCFYVENSTVLGCNDNHFHYDLERTYILPVSI